MKITCQACSAKYTIADDKVRGRKVKIRCKGCGTPIVVDGQQPNIGDELVGSPSNSVPPPAGPATTSPSAPPPALAMPAEVTWNVNLSDTDSRTMTTQEILGGWAAGVVTGDAFVWKDGMADWLPILDCAELAPYLGTPPAASPTGTPYGPPVMLAPVVAAAPAEAQPGFPQHGGTAQPAQARLAGGRQGAADLFGGVESAGSEQDVAMGSHALPTAPGSTAYDDKPTGARNENSVLFSLDSLKAGFAAPAAAAPVAAGKAPPRAPSARGAQTSNPDDPFGMGNQSSVLNMAGGGSNALFSLADNNALLTAPAPPEPPPVVAASLDIAGAQPVSPAQKRKQQMMIGAIVGGVLLVGIVLGLVLGGGDDKEEAKNDATSSAKAASEAVKEKDKAEEKKDEPKPEEPKPEEKKDEAKPDEKAADAKTPDATKKGGAGPAKEKEKKEEPAAPAGDAPPFSKASAISALGAAAAQAGGCKKPGGPTGAGKVQVTFAPSGRVTTANIAGPPFAGTAVGGCIAGAFRRAKVPPFSGNPVTVQKSFSVN